MKPHALRRSLEKLPASRRTELAEAMLRSELANMNKALRTPINAIVGLVHLLRRDRPTPEQADRLNKIADAVDHLSCIVDDMFDQAPIDAPAAAQTSPPNTADERATEAILRIKCRGARLLLVDDNPVNRGIALDLIQAAGLTADTAANGMEAVEKAALINYDLILMDVQMPMMNGLEATRAIRLRHNGAAVPVLAMTANAFEEARRACLEAGMNDLVAKPVNPHDFYISLLTWLPVAQQQACSPIPAAAINHDEERWQLLQVPGLDSGRGLATMRGNVEKYITLLQLFADECRRQALNLSGMLSQGEIVAIEPAACSVRGTAAMLGASEISVAADALVLACRIDAATETIGPACNVLIEVLSRCAGAIEGAVPKTVETANPELPPGQLADMLAQLASLLEHGNIEATHLARENTRLLEAAFGTRAKVLLARIDAFDYEGAVAELGQNLADMNGAAE